MSANDSGRLELVATGFSFPTSLTFDEEGTTYVAEAGLPFGGARPGGRIWRIDHDGDRSLWPADYDIRSTVLPTIGGVSMFQKGAIPDGSAGSTSMGSKRSS